jgi:cell division transport system permease protein
MVKEAFEGVRRGTFHSFIAAAAVALAMSVLGFFAYGALNLQRFASGLLNQLQIEAYISSALPESSHFELQKTIESLDPRWKVQYISKDQAATTFAKEFDSQIFDVLKDNPLPASFKITLPPTQNISDAYKQAVDKLNSLDGIDDVVYDKDLLDLILSSRQKLSDWGYFGTIAVILIALGIIFNAARVKIDSHKDAVQLMSLLGATPLVMRSIYLIQLAILGGIGGIISTMIIVSLKTLMQMRVASGLEIVAPHSYLLAIGGLILGMMGGGLAVGRYLRV